MVGMIGPHPYVDLLPFLEHMGTTGRATSLVLANDTNKDWGKSTAKILQSPFFCCGGFGRACMTRWWITPGSMWHSIQPGSMNDCLRYTCPGESPGLRVTFEWTRNNSDASEILELFATTAWTSLSWLMFLYLPTTFKQVSVKWLWALQMTCAQCRGRALGSSERWWRTWAVEADCLPYNPGLTTSWLYDLEQQWHSFLICKMWIIIGSKTLCC